MKLMQYAVITTITILLTVTNLHAFTVKGLLTKPSKHSVDATIDRYESALKKGGLTIFTRLDHSAAAESVGLKMPRTTVIVFGNPRAGTPVFLKTPTVAIDLPLKAMVWENADGQVFLSYNSADYLNNTIYVRHGASYNKAKTEKFENFLAAIADEAVK